MKTFFLLAFLALVASTAFAQYAEVPSGDVEGPSAGLYEQWDAEGPGTGSSEQCEQEHTKLDSCGDYLMERCTPKETPWIIWPWKWGKRSCEEVRNRCCQQLEQTTSQCRCKAILRTIQGELSGFLGSQEGQKARAMQMAQSLPSKCKMSPRSCNIPITGGYYW
uniref:Uncharacterized protein n=1 Tax=Avena sativa TaxID=4498 RepID=A0ACD5X7I9_AVESA